MMESNSTNTCSCCGNVQELSDFDMKFPIPQKMKAEQLCFSCAFWKDKIEHPPEHRQIINGVHYTVHPWSEVRLGFMGHSGSVFYIRETNGSIHKSNNVWCQGDIPGRFKKDLQDTAAFITKDAFAKIKRHDGGLCQAKGCWDRYHCYWYNLELESNQQPYNVIPKSHVVGGEECESFINKNEVYV